MRASAPRGVHAARVALGALVLLVVLLSAVSAQADPASSLRATNASLAAKSRSVLLELYALDSQLGRAERRLAALRSEAEAVEQRRESARAQLALVRRTLEEGEGRLALRLRELYIEGDPDPLAVLLGASSLDDAITSLENLGRFAKQDREIVAQVSDARAAVKAALANLAAREGELRRLTAGAEAARSGLLAARSERSSYLAGLLRQRRVNQAELDRVAAQSQEIASHSDDTGSGDVSESEPGSSGGSPPPLVTGGTRMTVQSTGYCLQGTTATGIPVSWGVVAVDPSVIPLGTRMTVPGYGEGVAADTGSAVKGAIIDLWFPSCAQAIVWGRRTVTITLH
ncbi:MAG: 3D domain-containing protein [Actinomycetota bacterium]|nr:3D domain-containing protein [Actinomycetota bacterium]